MAKSWRWWTRLLLVSAVAAAALYLYLQREHLQVEALRQVFYGVGGWAPVLYVGAYIIGGALFVPATLLTVLGGALFGLWWGVALALSGALASAVLAFWLARLTGAAWLRRRLGDRLRRLVAGVEEEGWRFVAFVRLVPIFPFALLNYALGLTPIGALAYTVTSLVCMLPGTLVYVYLGHVGIDALTGGGAARNVLIALSLVVALTLLPRLVKRLRKSWRGREAIDDRPLGAELLTAPLQHPAHARRGQMIGFLEAHPAELVVLGAA